MTKLHGFVSFLLVSVFLSVQAFAADGDLFIQVELNTDPQGCSILKVNPQGELSQFISNAQILAVNSDTNADCDDAGLAVGLDGKVYFNEDSEDNILVATPEGVLSIFITDTVVDSIITGNVDWDNGLAVGPQRGDLFAADENNEIIFKFPTDVPTPITDTDLIEILAEKEDFEELAANVDFEGGIAVDFQDNVYITNDDSANDVDNLIFKLTNQGDISILCSQEDLAAVTGSTNMDFDVGAVFGFKLYVADDGDCDCVLEIDTRTCNPRVIIRERDISDATGGSVDMEGGLCIDPQRNLYIGDDGNSQPNIVKSPDVDRADTSLFASAADIDSLYSVLEPGSNPRLRGSCSVEGDLDRVARPIPTLSEWGLIAMAGLIGIIGFFAIRKRAAA